VVYSLKWCLFKDAGVRSRDPTQDNHLPQQKPQRGTIPFRSELALILYVNHAEGEQGPDLVMVVYDCTNQDSLKSSLKWLDKNQEAQQKEHMNGEMVDQYQERT
jgi:hypothetical protein